MMRLLPEENELVGQWIFRNNMIIPDSVCERIKFLLNNHLTLIKSDDSGWNQLFKDNQDNRYWELSYPQGDLEGGGPPRLRSLSFEEANRLYNIEAY
jgi:hypothetical protein